MDTRSQCIICGAKTEKEELLTRMKKHSSYKDRSLSTESRATPGGDRE